MLVNCFFRDVHQFWDQIYSMEKRWPSKATSYFKDGLPWSLLLYSILGKIQKVKYQLKQIFKLVNTFFF